MTDPRRPVHHPVDKAEARAEREAAYDALDRALPLLRNDLLLLLEADSLFDEVDEDRVRRPGSSEPDTAGLANDYIEAINAAEKQVGRCIDDCPQWLDDLLDGRMLL